MKPKIIYDNKSAVRPVADRVYLQTIADLMSEKLRIRHNRNIMADNVVPATARAIPTPHLDHIEVENVSQHMAQTTMDWHSTRKPFSQKCETARS